MSVQLTLTVTPKELERQAAAVFHAKPYRVFLALRQDTGLGVGSTSAAWAAEKLATSNGYADVTGTLASGTYNTNTAAFELPAITATFTASGAGFTFRYAVLTDSTTGTNVGYWDYGSSQAVAAGETVTVTLDGTNGVFQAT